MAKIGAVMTAVQAGTERDHIIAPPRSQSSQAAEHHSSEANCLFPAAFPAANDKPVWQHPIDRRVPLRSLDQQIFAEEGLSTDQSLVGPAAGGGMRSGLIVFQSAPGVLNYEYSQDRNLNTCCHMTILGQHGSDHRLDIASCSNRQTCNDFEQIKFFWVQSDPLVAPPYEARLYIDRQVASR
ncbi:MAG: hypothetical protein K2Q28_14165 [Hyphomicrobium sp.]|nr:hypothetical protein [Hyphomicrobium sp.]